MKEHINLFIELATIFHKHGYNLYLVGGASREFLLEEESAEFDCATDATPKDMKEFLPNAFYTFEKYGTVSLKRSNFKFEITTLRTEGKYINHRYPGNIKFVKELELDYKRRDFTINAIYIDKDLNIFDFTNGQEDLRNKKLRMIGNADERLKEDPLRIIRGLRFAAKLDLTIDESLQKAILDNKHLLKKLNQEKIMFEKQKVEKKHLHQFNQLLLRYGI